MKVIPFRAASIALALPVKVMSQSPVPVPWLNVRPLVSASVKMPTSVEGPLASAVAARQRIGHEIAFPVADEKTRLEFTAMVLRVGRGDGRPVNQHESRVHVVDRRTGVDGDRRWSLASDRRILWSGRRLIFVGELILAERVNRTVYTPGTGSLKP